MPDEKPYKYENLPIPSYEEATSSRTPAPAVPRPNYEPGDDEERQGLIGYDHNGPERQPVPTRRAGYRPPQLQGVDAIRDSLEDADFLPGGDEDEDGARDSEDEVRAEMEQMEIIDAPAPSSSSTWTKRITSISASLSFIHLPLNLKLPNWKFKFNFKMPAFDSNLFIMLGRIFAIFLVTAVVYLLFVSGVFRTSAARMQGQMYPQEQVRIFVQGSVNAGNIRGYLERISAYSHVAGTEGDYVLTQWVEDRFEEFGLEDVRMEEFGVYLNYPKEGGRAVELLGMDGEVRWRAEIEEKTVYESPPRQQTAVFHGHSRAGDVKGPLIYANYGSREDFKRLQDSGIETTGAIALVKYYGSQGDRSMKVKAAELAGFVGCIIYSDPSEDGFLKGEVWPNGRYLPSDGVQRGSVSLTSWVVGDVLTPGWASKPGQERVSKDNNTGLNNIPSIPLSWRDAQPLLQALKGYGQPCPPEWQGGVPNIEEWWSGNLSSPIVHLKNEQDEVEQQPIWNVMGRILGVEQGEKSIIIGNHRDSWDFGAVDPGSGTAVLIEVARVFGNLVSRGWRPLRTIEFASWDGEEYNLIGSTEYVEDNMDRLRRDGFAYLNVDVGVSGPNFRAAASPVFHKALMRVLDRTSDPFLNETLRKLWDDRGNKLEGLGAGSDYVAFQDMAGMSSIDLGFEGPPYPYHSVYENFEWMDRFGDPGFQYHEVLAQILALLILEYAERPVMPFDMTGYARAITDYLLDLKSWLSPRLPAPNGVSFSLASLQEAVLQFQSDAQKFEDWESAWERVVYSGGGFESASLEAHRMSHNTRMADFETHLLDLEDGGGLPGRKQFKHILFAPQAWSGYDEAIFPAIRDAVEAGDWELAQKQVDKAASLLKKAGHRLIGNS